VNDVGPRSADGSHQPRADGRGGHVEQPEKACNPDAVDEVLATPPVRAGHDNAHIDRSLQVRAQVMEMGLDPSPVRRIELAEMEDPGRQEPSSFR
jgi:hypothetical protein